MLHILAGNYQQAKDAARHLTPADWRYVHEPQHLLGFRGGEFAVVGTFWERRDAGELIAVAHQRGMTRVEIEEQP